jgi:nucleotide sugar dehydrogenase
LNLLEKIKKKKATIAIIGLGYVGLPTALAFAKKGLNVIGIDVDSRKIEMINKGISPIKEEALIKDVAEMIKQGNLQATNDYEMAIKQADVVLSIVPTPVNDAKEPDLVFVKSSARSIAQHLQKGQLVILESTVYPGVTEEVMQPLLEESDLKTPADFGLAYCPERFNPGDPEHTVEKVVRVIGANNNYWRDAADTLYSHIQQTFTTRDIKTAEAAKVIENTQRDLNIALMNEIALICERLDLDVKDVLEAAKTKWNFGNYYPGPGVGGHCLPHDPYYLVKKAKEHGYHPQVILAGRKVNDDMPYHVIQLLIKALNHGEKAIKNANIVIYGATYKKNIDDLRTSPTETLVKALREFNANIQIIEPNVQDEFVFGCKRIDFMNSNELSTMDALIFMVGHDQFDKITIEYLQKIFQEKENVVIIDGIRMLDGHKLKELGFIYHGIGSGLINNSYFGD